MNRREFLKIPGFVAGSSLKARAADGPPSAATPVSVAKAFDREVESFMADRRVVGGALAVVKDRRLVYARGYGWADRDRKIAPTPASLFRIASISKPVTAVAVLKLAEDGKLDLDARAFEIVRLQPILDPDAQADPRLAAVTVRHLLQHTGGWDRDQSFDPMFRPEEIAAKARVSTPAGPEAVIRYMLGQRLDFDPGTRYAYSNFGYCVLGRVIEKVSGVSYENFVRQKILSPIGIHRMRIGGSLIDQQAPGEVRYYTRGDTRVKGVFPDQPGPVPLPYGSFYLEAMDAHGGWIASAVDLARFAAALDDPNRSPILKPETFRTMYAPPAPPASRKPDGSLEDYYYGCGWMVRPVQSPGKANYWHTGGLPGTSTLLVRRSDGLSWTLLFNRIPDSPADKESKSTTIDAALHRAANSVTQWPSEDLFSRWPETAGQ